MFGLLGLSEDATRAYVISKEALDAGASAGAANLYLYEAGTGFTFIVTLVASDVANGVDVRPTGRTSRVSADGLHAAFMSQMSPPSGYDNRDANSSQPDAEVYSYDAVNGKLRCVSCNPTEARPVGANDGNEVVPFWAAARIHAWERNLYGSRHLSEDGTRLFFESHEALAPQDVNGAWDVYEWEEAGAGTCTEARPTFSPKAEGCIELISSGRSPEDSTFLDADPSGHDVFIATLSGLVDADYGLFDVYDARVGGGFAKPALPVECEGEACQSPPPAPEDATPASSSFDGPGNLKPSKARCARGKARKRGHCVRKRHRRAHAKRKAERR